MNSRLFKQVLTKAVVALVRRLPLKSRDPGRRVPVLCYHRVLPDFFEDLPYTYSILPQQFEAQMAFLAAARFRSLSLQEYGEMARGVKPIPPRSVLITFDDGLADTHAVAWPIAQKYGMRLNIFICTGFIGQPEPVLLGKDGYRKVEAGSALGEEPPQVRRHLQQFPHLWRPLTWPELRAWQQGGNQIGLHGHAHRKLACLSKRGLNAEVTAGVRAFEGGLGYRPRFFAPPYGWYDDYHRDIVRTLQGCGLDFIFGTHWGRALLPTDQPVFPRLTIWAGDDLDTFSRKILGPYDWLGKFCRVMFLLRAPWRLKKP